jgi:hypothetical protein
MQTSLGSFHVVSVHRFCPEPVPYTGIVICVYLDALGNYSVLDVNAASALLSITTPTSSFNTANS